MSKDKLIALAVAFGIATEGLTSAAKAQDALDANEGYRLYQEALTGKAEAENKLENLVGDLNEANKMADDLQSELDLAKDALCIEIENSTGFKLKVAELEKALADVAAPEEDNRILFESEDGNTYEVVVEKFLYAGTLYESAVAVEKNRDVLEAQVQAKSFILKKV